jgi:hypothetical protein
LKNKQAYVQVPNIYWDRKKELYFSINGKSSLKIALNRQINAVEPMLLPQINEKLPNKEK